MNLAEKLRTGSISGEELATLAKSLGIPVHPRTHANLRRRVIAASRKGFSTHRDWTPNTAAWMVLAKCIEQIDSHSRHASLACSQPRFFDSTTPHRKEFVR